MKNAAIITGLEDWKNIFNDDKHWKPGRSAYSLAEFMLKRNGIETIREILSACDLPNFQIANCYVETSVKFDKYPRPSQRDMVLTGTIDSSENKSEKVFITVEAKVDEEFGGGKIRQVINRQKAAAIDKQKRVRAEDLFDLIPNPQQEDGDLKYQLFHATAATLHKGLGEYGDDFQKSIMLVLVFKTSGYNTADAKNIDYDPHKGKKNFNDFVKFVEAITDHEDIRKFTKEIPVGKDSVKFLGEYTNNDSNKVTFIYAEIDFSK